ncbi:ATP-binding protein [Parageobacillus toebii]|nr:hypothetical protein B1A75_09545 [Geobacillus sp. LEMMY01]
MPSSYHLNSFSFHYDTHLLLSAINQPACTYEKLSLVTSNSEFGQWNTVFEDKRLTAAIIDYFIMPIF